MALIQHDTSTDRPNDPLRDALHQMWATAAAAWSQHATYVDERGAAVTEALLKAAAVRPGDHVLELA